MRGPVAAPLEISLAERVGQAAGLRSISRSFRLSFHDIQRGRLFPDVPSSAASCGTLGVKRKTM